MFKLVLSTLFSMLILTKIALSDGNTTNSTNHISSNATSTGRVSIDLKEDNFWRTLKFNHYSLVLFVNQTLAITNEHLKILDKEYEKAGKRIKSMATYEHLSVTIAKVNCEIEETLCKDQNISVFPKLKFYKRERFISDYKNAFEFDRDDEHIEYFFHYNIAGVHHPGKHDEL